MEVRPRAAWSRSSITCASVAASSADVASSQNKTGASFSSARAMLTRCFSPPDSFRPLSPTAVSRPSLHDSRTESSLTAFSTSSTSSSEAQAPARP
mmetsp:Transcript_81704/g.163112  ORF Transcript_81704/g.163112 Transcript_81704/m.163112 type:complete len:96 (+) Transcript_81704:530-817(+)